MISEADQEGAVLRSQHLAQEDLQVMLMLLSEVVLAAAGIHDQAECERDIEASGEERYLLRDRIFKNFQIITPEIVHQGAAFIANRERNIHQLDVYSDGLLANS